MDDDGLLDGILFATPSEVGIVIRDGARGEGKWRQVSWEEAFDYVAAELQKVKETYGARGIAFSDRGGPFRDLHRAFLKGLPSGRLST